MPPAQAEPNDAKPIINHAPKPISEQTAAPTTAVSLLPVRIPEPRMIRQTSVPEASCSTHSARPQAPETAAKRPPLNQAETAGLSTVNQERPVETLPAHASQRSRRPEPVSTSPVTDIASIRDTGNTAPNTNAVIADPHAGQSKKVRRRKAKKQNEKRLRDEMAANVRTQRLAKPTSGCNPPPSETVAAVPDPVPPTAQLASAVAHTGPVTDDRIPCNVALPEGPEAQPQRVLLGYTPSAENIQLQPELQSSPSFPKPPYPYSRLSELAKNGEVDIICVVTSGGDIYEPKVQAQDFRLSIRLVDPSLGTEAGGAEWTAILFKPAKEQLPQIVAGNIVVLHCMKVDLQVRTYSKNGASGINLVGYKTFRWAVYNPVTKQMRRGPGEHGVIIEPAQSGVSEYLQQLASWWNSTRRPGESLPDSGVEHQIVQRAAKSRRQHCLISEASGYFTCTLEIVARDRTREDTANPQVIYATDYTEREGLEEDPCKEGNSKMFHKIIRVEMWDEAAKLANEMHPGEFWRMDNVRMMEKSTYSGYVEAKFVEGKKARLLDEKKDSNDQHLSALLKRKEKLALHQPYDSNPHLLLQDVIEEKFCNLTLEILHIAHEEETVIYGTDYTRNPYMLDASRGLVGQPWSEGLEGRILRIVLEGDQADRVKQLGYYELRSVRLHMTRVKDNQLICKLGGSGRLIVKINEKGSNPHFKELLRRKSEWTSKQETITTTFATPFKQETIVQTPEVKMETDEASVEDFTGVIPPQESGHNPMSAVDAIQNCEPRLQKFTLRAHIIKFGPRRLQEWIVRRCSRCNEYLQPCMQRCFACYESTGLDDLAVDHRCNGYLELEDETGLTMTVAVTEATAFIGAHSQSHDDLSERLSTSLCRLLGNCMRVRQQAELGHPLGNQTPWFNMVIASWPCDSTEVAFTLINYSDS
ncbi:hypothetical protein PUNSTDRAFT_127012 [Punctularia strigosozonata HHB-11173 SS5]|uniref:uncharacterized protein n=1 Tax=Punctularia strigosozonata (strain HHB-11173) TaxID=741275 RepID=UPI0004416D9A|nr:uncharacterized protein PUNSTDRAFT_127012 [Punctularia strigosozonata HHB-11173 SS5]EIN07216.1 hypothetical protein PUNSTDRAFT_127012 [Punctularia strigosozonata HHB-11173 SS5]